MSQRGRPKNRQRSIRIMLSGWLHPEQDADIIAWLESVPKGQRMNAFKTALRSGGLGVGLAPENGNADEVLSTAEDILSNWDF